MKLNSSSACHFWSPRFSFWTPCGRFFSVGSSLIFVHTSPLDHARREVGADRRCGGSGWCAGSSSGPEPKPISATAFSGTEPPLEVGTGRFSSVDEVAPRVFGQRHRDRHLAVGQREFGAVLLDVAQGRDADRLAQRRGRHAEVGGQVEARLDGDFRPRELAPDARRAQAGNGLHLLGDLVGDRGQLLRIVAAEIEHDVAARPRPVRRRSGSGS